MVSILAELLYILVVKAAEPTKVLLSIGGSPMMRDSMIFTFRISDGGLSNVGWSGFFIAQLSAAF